MKVLSNIKNFIINNLHWLIVSGVTVLCVVFLLFGYKTENGYITLDGKDVVIEESTKEFITYAKEQIQAYITNEYGEEEAVDVPTVELVDSETTQESGQGTYIYAPTDSYTAFKNYTIGKCWNTDGAYGAQCWDLGDLFWQNFAGRQLSTCGTGAAKGIWSCKEYNAGSEFTLIYDKTQIKAGDWIITSGGTYGHVAMALGSYNDGYVSVLGQNQGGASCSGGGAAANIINLNMSTFSGAFRPNYSTPEPEPEPEPEPDPTPVSQDCTSWTLVYGDTLGEIMKTCEGSITWGEAMNEYARKWTDITTGKTVYEGWSTYPGIGLYAGHTITKE